MDISEIGLPDDSLLDHIDYQTHRRKMNRIIIISMTICIILLILSTLFIYLFIKKQQLSSSIKQSTETSYIITTLSRQINNLSLIGNIHVFILLLNN